MELILAVLGGMLVAALSRLVSDELKAWRPWIVERLILIAERRLPAKHLKRLAEEWRSYVAEIPGDVGKVIAACGFIKASKTIRGRVSLAPLDDRLISLASLVDRFHETNQFGRAESRPDGPHPEERASWRASRRMAAGATSLVAVLRDARKSALLWRRLMMVSI
jgi:hypothetical protein